MKVNRIFHASWDHSTVEINSVPAGVYRATEAIVPNESASRRLASPRVASRRVASSRVQVTLMEKFRSRRSVSLRPSTDATVERATNYGGDIARDIACPRAAVVRETENNGESSGETAADRNSIVVASDTNCHHGERRPKRDSLRRLTAAIVVNR